MLKIKEVRFTKVLNKIDVTIGMEVGQTENISVPLSMGIIEDKGHSTCLVQLLESKSCVLQKVGPKIAFGYYKTQL